MHFTYKYLKCIYFKWAMPYTISEPYNLYGACLENQCILQPDKFNLTSAITTLLPPTPPTRSYLTQTTDQAPLACEAADFWPFLTIILIFLVAFCCICAVYT